MVQIPLFFPFRRERQRAASSVAASRNVDKSVKVSLNLKSVSNQIDRCNNIQRREREREGGREKRGNFHDDGL